MGDNDNAWETTTTRGRQRRRVGVNDDAWETTTTRGGRVVGDCRGTGHVWETLREHVAGLGLVCGETSCG